MKGTALTVVPYYIYIGVTELGFSKHETWKMTIYQLVTLFKIHKRFHPDRYEQETAEQTIDDIFD